MLKKDSKHLKFMRTKWAKIALILKITAAKAKRDWQRVLGPCYGTSFLALLRQGRAPTQYCIRF